MFKGEARLGEGGVAPALARHINCGSKSFSHSKRSLGNMDRAIGRKQVPWTHSGESCPLTQQTLLISSRRLTPFAKGIRYERRSHLPRDKCRAIAEAETETKSVDDANFDIEEFSSRDFKTAFDELLEKTKTRFDIGDRVKGVVESVDENGAHIDIGAKAAAFLPVSNISAFKIQRAAKAIQTGEEREFYVAEKNYRSRRKRPAVVLSIKEFEQEMMWKRINQLAEEKASFQEQVVGVNNGGLFVNLEGVRAFCPGSHIPQSEKRDGMEELVGKTLMFGILEANQPRLILSARQQFNTAGAQQKEYKVGDVVLGTVQSVQLYGAFLEFEDGTSGLLHVSQISHDRVSNVGDVLSVGDKIKVMVLTQDVARGRLSLSTRKLEPTPGDMIRNPAVVFEKADEMAEEFRKRIAEAEAEFGTEGGNLF